MRGRFHLSPHSSLERVAQQLLGLGILPAAWVAVAHLEQPGRHPGLAQIHPHLHTSTRKPHPKSPRALEWMAHMEGQQVDDLTHTGAHGYGASFTLLQGIIRQR